MAVPAVPLVCHAFAATPDFPCQQAGLGPRKHGTHGTQGRTFGFAGCRLATEEVPIFRARPALDFRLFRTLAALALFGASFGYVEAAVVVYVRASYEPLHQQLHPERSPTDLFPVLLPAQLEAAGPQYVQHLYTELVREAVTLVMLAAVALVAARSMREWFAAFVVVFGAWDIFFYVFLRVLIGWPVSLFDWDLLFLLPLPWVGPVLAPVLVALAMIAAGVAMLNREAAGRPVRLGGVHWAAISSGGFVVIVAFCWDWRNILEGGLPNPFPWRLFAFGLLLGLASFLHARARPGPEYALAGRRLLAFFRVD